MKKIFIGTLLLVSCTVVSAQQKLSFKDYLDKTNSVSSHSFPFTPHKPYYKVLGRPAENSMTTLQKGSSMTLESAKLNGILPNGNKLYRLPLDNMICIVPDMSQFHMPVAGIGQSDFGDKRINLLNY